jgi:hypothetical protein
MTNSYCICTVVMKGECDTCDEFPNSKLVMIHVNFCGIIHDQMIKKRIPNLFDSAARIFIF